MRSSHLLGGGNFLWADVTWKAQSTTATAAGTLVDNSDLTATTVFTTTLNAEEKTIAGESFTHYIQVRNEAYPTTSVPNGTEKSGSTSIVIATKVAGTLTLYYMRQIPDGWAVDDGKDVRVYQQSNANLVSGTNVSEDADVKNSYISKTVELKANTTYTISAKGTTIRFYGFNYKEDTKKTTTTVNSAKSNLHAYLDNAGSINDAANCLSFTNYQMTVDGTNIQVGNAQYQFVVNSTNYTGVKFGKQTYVITPLAGVTITNVKAYGSSNSSSTITISSGESDLELAARGDKNSPVTMSPLTLSKNDGGLYYFSLNGDASQAILVFDVTYDQAENVDVTISDAGYATLYYDKKLAIPAGVTAYAATVKDAETITLTEIENVIPANTGVILKADAGKYNFAVTNADAPAVDNNILVGTTTATTKAALGGTVYTLGQDGEGVVGLRSFTGTDIRAYSAYATSIAASARGFFTFETETTGVKAIEKTQSANNAYYNLAGQRVAQPQKGLYIVNGKKIIIK